MLDGLDEMPKYQVLSKIGRGNYKIIKKTRINHIREWKEEEYTKMIAPKDDLQMYFIQKFNEEDVKYFLQKLINSFNTMQKSYYVN